MNRPVVVVVGLGPAGPDLVTAGALEAVALPARRFLRTSRHPSSVVVDDATTFDHLYEQADTFADVYRDITDALVAAATEEGRVVYAVPGSPLVLERSVRHLLGDARVSVEVVLGLSFLDLAYGRLGLDPIEAGLRLVDGHEFATAAAGERGPLLVAHTHAPWVLSDIKLAVNSPGSEPVVVLQRLGLPEEQVTTVAWADLDRSVEPDHLTCLYIPELAEPVGHELVRFHGIVRRLRDECPWDRQQTHQTLTRYAVEEVYELIEAIGELDGSGAADEALEEELGDVLLQVYLHAAIAEQQGRFSVADVASTISAKMIRRHPHVFGSTDVSGPDQVIHNWELIKAAEKASGPGGAALASSVDGVPGDLPALAYARELSAKASRAGFDWDDPRGTLDKVVEEVDEVRGAFDDPASLTGEVGDLLFAVVNLSRHRNVDPEAALRIASAKFRRRIAACEVLAEERGIDTRTAGLAVLEALWEDVKTAERLESE
ncbi:MAG TPA: nucleoside triphosphate pyrophosphohydrolase [Acidimicrobiales bacterium]|nr:nucleoside triphosphate pyrophosphohydrolase [Acidimicrobiales bacterium]